MSATRGGEYQPIAEDIEFCEHIVARIPELHPLWRQHLEEELGEPLPYVFFFALALWAEDHAASQPESVRGLLSILNEGLDTGSGDVPNLVVTGLVESMSGGTALIPLISGALKPWVDLEFGVSDSPPSLRRASPVTQPPQDEAASGRE